MVVEGSGLAVVVAVGEEEELLLEECRGPLEAGPLLCPAYCKVEAAAAVAGVPKGEHFELAPCVMERLLKTAFVEGDEEPFVAGTVDPCTLEELVLQDTQPSCC